MSDSRIKGGCPKCGCRPSRVSAGHHGPTTWSCGSGWDRMFDPHVFVQSEPCKRIAELEAALAREKRVVEALLIGAPLCGSGCIGWRNRACNQTDVAIWNSDDCKTRRRKGAEAEADRREP